MVHKHKFHGFPKFANNAKIELLENKGCIRYIPLTDHPTVHTFTITRTVGWRSGENATSMVMTSSGGTGTVTITYDLGVHSQFYEVTIY